jgi:hypothetical protein
LVLPYTRKLFTNHFSFLQWPSLLFLQGSGGQDAGALENISPTAYADITADLRPFFIIYGFGNDRWKGLLVRLHSLWRTNEKGEYITLGSI